MPMPHRVAAGGAALRMSSDANGATITELAPGDIFEVLDIAGQWAWGTCGPDGPVGYVALDLLEG
jgi:hypothetical protein